MPELWCWRPSLGRICHWTPSYSLYLKKWAHQILVAKSVKSKSRASSATVLAQCLDSAPSDFLSISKSAPQCGMRLGYLIPARLKRKRKHRRAALLLAAPIARIELKPIENGRCSIARILRWTYMSTTKTGYTLSKRSRRTFNGGLRIFWRQYLNSGKIVCRRWICSPLD